MNERFSVRGHARHICRECQKLSREELTYRQHVRNIEGCLTDEGMVRRKRRRFVEQFLGHDDLRLRAWADELLTRIPVGAEDDVYDEVEPADLFDDGELVI